MVADDQAVHQLRAKYAVVVGTPTVERVQHIHAVNPQTHVGVIVLLPSSGLRAVASGIFARPLPKGFFLGEDQTLAPAYAVVEGALAALNTSVAREAYTLAVEGGLDMRTLSEALGSGAGGSAGFNALWGPLLSGESAETQLRNAAEALSSALALASEIRFYAPLMALARQSLGPVTPNPTVKRKEGKAAKHPESQEPSKVAFIGLGSMGLPMAKHLHALPEVVGYDVSPVGREAFKESGGRVADSAADCASGAEVLVLMVVNVAQAEDVLLASGALTALAPGACVLFMATGAPGDVLRMQERLTAVRTDVALLDVPVSGGTPRAASGELTLFCGGLEGAPPETAAKARAVLHRLGSIVSLGAVGAGSAAKLSNQHLAGCGISSVAETLAFATVLGLPGRLTRELLLQGPARSWMLGHRGGNMLAGLRQPPTSAITIFVKDMGIVVGEATRRNVSVPLAATVQQQFVFCASLGWDRDDDSGLVRIWELAGIDVRC